MRPRGYKENLRGGQVHFVLLCMCVPFKRTFVATMAKHHSKHHNSPVTSNPRTEKKQKFTESLVVFLRLLSVSVLCFFSSHYVFQYKNWVPLFEKINIKTLFRTPMLMVGHNRQLTKMHIMWPPSNQFLIYFMVSYVAYYYLK